MNMLVIAIDFRFTLNLAKAYCLICNHQNSTNFLWFPVVTNMQIFLLVGAVIGWLL